MKIVLLGANGQLGQAFVKDGSLAKLGALISVTRRGQLADGTHCEACDLSNPEELAALLERIHPKIIINAAAYTAVDRAEENEAVATRINGGAVAAMGAWAAANEALVMHYSTDYVFDGHGKLPYTVDAPTSPLSAYGRSKLAGELALDASGAHHMTFRIAWVYAAHGHNFLLTMLRIGAERDTLRVVADQYGAPTPTHLIVNGTMLALKAWLYASPAEQSAIEGTYHLAANGSTTWHGFATAIFDEAHARGLIAAKPIVTAIGTADFPTPARRPAYSVLDNSRFEKQFQIKLPDWRHGLTEVMTELSASKG